MKTVTVTYGPVGDQESVRVEMRQYPSSQPLTASLARSARNIAAGMFANATVTDGATTYRVTKTSCRKVANE